MSCKLAFQSSCSQWSFRKAGSRSPKNKEQTAKEKENISILSAKTVSTGGRRHCCHGYKITNTYEGLRSSHRHLRKHGLFSGWLKIQTVSRQGTGPCLVVTVESWERHDWEEDMHNSAVWKNVKPKNKGANWKDVATIKTPQGQKMTHTGQNNLANWKHTKFTIFHLR